jgi:hypothetical protein
MADQVFALAYGLLEAAAEQLDPPPTTRLVVPGTAVAWDVTGDGLLWVRVTGIAPNTINGSCCTDFLRVSLAIGVLRCTPVMDDEGCPPDPDEQTAQAQMLLADQDVLLSTLETLYCSKGPPSLATARWTPLGPEGGVVGGEWAFDLRVQR